MHDELVDTAEEQEKVQSPMLNEDVERDQEQSLAAGASEKRVEEQEIVPESPESTEPDTRESGESHQLSFDD